MDIGWPVLDEKFVLTGDCFSFILFNQTREQADSPANSVILVQEINSEKVLFPENSIIQ